MFVLRTGLQLNIQASVLAISRHQESRRVNWPRQSWQITRFAEVKSLALVPAFSLGLSMLLSCEKLKEGINFFKIWHRVEGIATRVPGKPFADGAHAAFDSKLHAFRWRAAYIATAFALLLLALMSAFLVLLGDVLCTDGVATLEGCLSLPWMNQHVCAFGQVVALCGCRVWSLFHSAPFSLCRLKYFGKRHFGQNPLVATASRVKALRIPRAPAYMRIDRKRFVKELVKDDHWVTSKVARESFANRLCECIYLFFGQDCDRKGPRLGGRKFRER